MKSQLKLLVTLLLILSLLAGGCATNGTTHTAGTTTNGSSATSPATTGTVQKNAVDLMSAVHAAERPATPAVPDEAIRKAVNRFSAALFKASADKKGNVMVSPASVYLALAMTLNGADGETKAAMLKVLADQGLTVDMINQASRDWMTLLAKSGSKTTVSIANSIWFDQEFAPYKPFLQANADYYAAGARKLDFKNKASVDIINGWVKEATKGTIDKIVDEIRPDVVLYLINAIYFKSDWLTPFEKSDTHNRTFNTPGGAIETPFLKRTGKMSYFSGNNATGVALPYDDGQFAYFALLPDGQTTPREWLAKQEPATLFANIVGMMSQKSNFTVDLAMPKFESRYEDSLLDELTGLGMGIAFDPGKADFSQMNESHTKDLYIGEVKHKTYVRVDEKGTEAAAVTSVEMRVTSLPMSDKQLTFDRPFLYGIMDLKTGLPLFVGIMENPSAS